MNFRGSALSDKMRPNPFGLSILLLKLVVSISIITRIALLIDSASNVDFTFRNILGMIGIGLLYDLVNAIYFILPITLYIWLIPSRLFVKKWNRILLSAVFFLLTFFLIFNASSEWFFWDEFNSRYNYIAADYLVYAPEIAGNAEESYPVNLILAAQLLVTILLFYFSHHGIKNSFSQPNAFVRRTYFFVPYFGLVICFYFLIDKKIRQFSPNTYVNELAGNGLYELSAAYLNRNLDYEPFYAKIPANEASEKIRKQIKTPESQFVNNDPYSIERNIIHEGPEKRMNVILISAESLSAEFLGTFGNKNNITPNLDTLAEKSMLFTNLYATGTRTVRGLEALSLGTPPTPGQAILRRPNNENLFSLGKVFRQKGYDTKFICGGHGNFDNMSYFFSHNNYEVDDRDKISKKDIDYESVWGVADENLFGMASREIEKSIGKGKPVFAHIMTTSNHRPFSYPEGRIDIPSHRSREGAVKYADYAIGEFIRAAGKKTWFKNTVFVIIADHCASSAGKAELPVDRYHIPLLIYSPGNVKPRRIDRLMSQIDMAPTVLGLLNFSYTSKFFGYDIFELEPGRERAFISTYQNLGFIRKDTLIILKPDKTQNTFVPDFTDGSVRKANPSPSLTSEAISWYQTANFQFKHGMMN